MASSRIRMTTTVRLVLDALAHAGPDDPLWGYKLIEVTGLGSGTVYPIMERLESGGYVSARVESPRPADRPPRRFYELTGSGRQLAVDAVTLRTSRLRGFRAATERPGTLWTRAVACRALNPCSIGGRSLGRSVSRSAWRSATYWGRSMQAMTSPCWQGWALAPLFLSRLGDSLGMPSEDCAPEAPEDRSWR